MHQPPFPQSDLPCQTLHSDGDASDSSLHHQIAQLLKAAGEEIRARRMALKLDNRSDPQLNLHAMLRLHCHQWHLSVGSLHSAQEKAEARLFTVPDPRSQRVFRFDLEPTPDWQGHLEAVFDRGLTPKSRKLAKLKRIVARLHDRLAVVLLRHELARSRTALQRHQVERRDLQRQINRFGKELYGIGQLPAMVERARNENHFLEQVFHTVLPLINARLGAIYLPGIELEMVLVRERDGLQCLHAPGLRAFLARMVAAPNFFPDRLPVTSQPLKVTTLPRNLQILFRNCGAEHLSTYLLFNREETMGWGLIGFGDQASHLAGVHIFISIMGLIRPILENFSFRRDFEKQVKLKAQEILILEKRFGVAFDYSKLLFPQPGGPPSGFTERVLQEVERSRSMALLGELAFGVAHQIRNPLNNLLAALHLIKDAETPQHEKDLLFNGLTERVETIDRMIKEFISYTRIPELNLNPESVNRVVQNTLCKFKAWMDTSGVTLKTDFDQRLPETQIDLYLMDQVFHNVIKNSLEAMYGQGLLMVSTRKLQIRHGPKPHLEFVKITFSDSGQGIPENQVDKVLRPFYSRKEDGMGLGMAVVDHIVRAHGGGVRVKSELGRGTAVTLFLPIR